METATKIVGLFGELLAECREQVEVNNVVLTQGVQRTTPSATIRTTQDWAEIMSQSLPRRMQRNVWVGSQSLTGMITNIHPYTPAELEVSSYGGNQPGPRNIHRAKEVLVGRGLLEKRQLDGCRSYQYKLAA